MKTLGLTGGIGMGKSACAQMLAERGIPVVDTDVLARDVVRPGQPAIAEIQAAFGNSFVGPDGALQRTLLARRVFSDTASRKQLEAILHPRIRGLWQEQVRTWQAEGKPLAVVVIPLLFETGAERDIELTLCVACSAGTQLKRLLTRGWTLPQIQQRMAAQWPIERKMSAANYVIWSEGTLEAHRLQLDLILGHLAKAREATRCG